MLRWRLVTWLILPLFALDCRLILADEMKALSEAFQPKEGSILPPGYSASQGTEPSSGLPELGLEEGAGAPSGPTPPPTSSGPTGPLTLEDLEQIALQFNPTLVQARMALQAAQGQYVQAGLYPNPTLGYVGDEAGNDGSAGLQGASVSQEILTAGKLRLGRAAASWQIRQARYTWEAQRRRVLNDVRAGYYEVLLAQKTLGINEQLVRVGDEGVEVTNKLRAAQEVSQADALQAQIEAERARLSFHEAQNRHQSAWRRLAAMLGRPEMKPAPVAGDLLEELPKLSFEDMLRALLAGSPELGRARAGVRSARCELALQYAERVPDFEIGGAVKYDHASHFTVADVELTMPLPLFNRNQGNLLKAHAELVAARQEVRRIELELCDRLAAAFEQYTNARYEVESYAGTILPNARASLDLVTTGYREGEFGYLTLLMAQRTYFNSNLEYLSSLRRLWTRRIEIEGMLLSGGLQRPE